MKVHYINILLFALPLNILVTSCQVNTQQNPSITPRHTPTIRLLCECDLYMPNYDNDPQMKSVMDNFNKQTQQRFHEYDERMQSKRMQCKDRCDKEIQKIILKDKLEKQMAQQLTTLETKINTDDIPTCICEKSLADKTEKFCLNCGKNLGVAVPGLGVLAGYGAYELVKIAMMAAIAAAQKAGALAGEAAGIQEVITSLNSSLNLDTFGGTTLNTVLNGNNFKNIPFIVDLLKKDYHTVCVVPDQDSDKLLCLIGSRNHSFAYKAIQTNVESAVTSGTKATTAKTEEMTSIYTTQELSKVTSTGAILSNPIIVSFVVIVIIVIILLIIYLILRYRRKKKMKKKLQYIKLLKE
ncbi:rifin PIR protein, putative [Plasmodium reichenowi]|uniref:Rifin PIR protein, putative n=1 Tax=Plasmodium reichenowi TaxID=5854 RepID=A0A2P9DSR2_PLARE|nr:rifin PIR protein, putative [Plasmodium reichenowi]SOV84040.1 rifin PIR protein, putative [Plasmodium reichenowi]